MSASPRTRIVIPIQPDLSKYTDEIALKHEEKTVAATNLNDFKDEMAYFLKMYFNTKRDFLLNLRLSRYQPKLFKEYLKTHGNRLPIQQLTKNLQDTINITRIKLADLRKSKPLLEMKLGNARKNYAQAQLQRNLEVHRGTSKLILNIDTMEKLLSRRDQISSTKITHTNDEIKITMYCPRIVMKPPTMALARTSRILLWDNFEDHFRDEHNIYNLNDIPEKMLQIPLAPLTCTINLPINNWGEFFAECSSDVNLRGFDHTYMPHPHWITYNKPCLGDFEATIMEAIQNGDLAMLADIYLQFLSQYNAKDCAGEWFPRWWALANNSVPCPTNPTAVSKHFWVVERNNPDENEDEDEEIFPSIRDEEQQLTVNNFPEIAPCPIELANQIIADEEKAYQIQNIMDLAHAQAATNMLEEKRKLNDSSLRILTSPGARPLATLTKTIQRIQSEIEIITNENPVTEQQNIEENANRAESTSQESQTTETNDNIEEFQPQNETLEEIGTEPENNEIQLTSDVTNTEESFSEHTLSVNTSEIEL